MKFLVCFVLCLAAFSAADEEPKRIVKRGIIGGYGGFGGLGGYGYGHGYGHGFGYGYGGHGYGLGLGGLSYGVHSAPIAIAAPAVSYAKVAVSHPVTYAKVAPVAVSAAPVLSLGYASGYGYGHGFGYGGLGYGHGLGYSGYKKFW